LFVFRLFFWLNKTWTVKPLRRFHSWSLSFTKDGLAFSTRKCAAGKIFKKRNAPQARFFDTKIVPQAKLMKQIAPQARFC